MRGLGEYVARSKLERLDLRDWVLVSGFEMHRDAYGRADLVRFDKNKCFNFEWHDWGNSGSVLVLKSVTLWNFLLVHDITVCLCVSEALLMKDRDWAADPNLYVIDIIMGGIAVSDLCGLTNAIFNHRRFWSSSKC